MRRLSGTIYAYPWWQVRVRRKLHVLEDTSRANAFEMERDVQDGARDGSPRSDHLPE